MNIVSLHHVPFEGLGSIKSLIDAGDHTLTTIPMWESPNLDAFGQFDLLIIMGGPMSVGDTIRYPWLLAEKNLIYRGLKAGKTILGICLGAQIIAEVLGARVYRGDHSEIGWFPVSRSPEAGTTVIGSRLPDQFNAFHWHADTFGLPAGAVGLGRSEACANQGFIYQENVIGLQFHLEATADSAAALIGNCPDDLQDGGDFVQNAESMLSGMGRFNEINSHMAGIWEQIEKMNYT